MHFVPLDPEASLVYSYGFISVGSLAMWSKTPQRAFFVNLDIRIVITGTKKAAYFRSHEPRVGAPRENKIR